MKTEPRYTFVCSVCGSHDLRVTCEITCKVIQTEFDTFETEPDDFGEWYFDKDSYMTCASCNHTDRVKEFQTPAQEKTRMSTYHVLIAYPEHMVNFNGDAYCETVKTDQGYDDAIDKVRRMMDEANDWEGEADTCRVLMVVRGGELL